MFHKCCKQAGEKGIPKNVYLLNMVDGVKNKIVIYIH